MDFLLSKEEQLLRQMERNLAKAIAYLKIYYGETRARELGERVLRGIHEDLREAIADIDELKRISKIVVERMLENHSNFFRHSNPGIHSKKVFGPRQVLLVEENINELRLHLIPLFDRLLHEWHHHLREVVEAQLGHKLPKRENARTALYVIKRNWRRFEQIYDYKPSESFNSLEPYLKKFLNIKTIDHKPVMSDYDALLDAVTLMLLQDINHFTEEGKEALEVVFEQRAPSRAA